MTTLLLQVLALASVGGQTDSVTFTCRAEPMSRLAGELGKATGLKLSASNACANDVILVSANGVSVKELLSEIAKVDAAVWNPLDGGYILAPDVIARRDEARHENEHQGNLIQALIAKKLKEAATVDKDKSKPGSETTVIGSAGGGVFSAMGGADPAATSVLKLLKELQPAALVVDANHRAVFSTHPNQMQLPLGSDSDAIVEQIIKQHNDSIPAGGDPDAAKNALDEKTGGQTPEFLKGLMGRMSKKITGYSKADLVVETMPFLGGLTASLVLYDAKGDVLLNSTEALDTSMIEALLAKPAPTTGTKTEIELSPETQAYFKFVPGVQGARQTTSHPIPALLKPFVSDPQLHDPLSLLPSDKLLGLAKASHKPLVAVVPDVALSLLSDLTNQKPTVEEFVQELDKGTSMVMAESNGWIEVKPIAPETARNNRTDRAALAKLMKAAQAKRIPSLDDMAEFAQKAPSPMVNGVSQVYLSLFVPGGFGAGMDGFTNWDMYRIYGQISPDRRQALLSGSKVPLESLTATQQTYLAEMVYGPLAQLQTGKAGNDSDIMSQMMTMSMGGNDYKDEATELLPSGVPGGGTFEMTAKEEPFLSPVSAGADGSEVPQIIGLDELAILKFFSEQPSFAQMAGMMPKFDKMKVGTRMVYHLTFHLTNEVRLTGTLKDSVLAADADTVSASDLPQSMQDQIAKKVEEFKKSPLGSLAALGALGGGAGAPPPR